MGKFSSILLLQLTFILSHIACLRLKKVTIPEYGVNGSEVRLACEFDLELDPLLSVKWYKDEREFYRYIPKRKISTFPEKGVFVDVPKSSLNEVILANVSLSTSGVYKCEVSADRPTYRTLYKESTLKIIAPPRDPPIINGIPSQIKMGDKISANCTSYRSKPSASLNFFVNQQNADRQDLIEYPPIVEKDGMETSTLGIQFILSPKNLRNNLLEIRCTATLGNGYWISANTYTESNYLKSLKNHENKGFIFSGGSRKKIFNFWLPLSLTIIMFILPTTSTSTILLFIFGLTH